MRKHKMMVGMEALMASGNWRAGADNSAET